MLWEEYIRAETLEEALDQLRRFDGEGRVIAGGTDLILQLKNGDHRVKCLVDISSVGSLSDIREMEDKITLGAVATHNQISRSDIIMNRATVLGEACGEIGSPQIRNIGTVGGNIVNALPSADSVIALLALGASCEVASYENSAEISVDQLFLGVGASRVDATRSVVTAITFDSQRPFEGSAFCRLTRRKGATCPILNCAVRVGWDESSYRIKSIRIAMGPVAPTPKRLHGVERVLTSDVFSDKLLLESLDSIVEEVDPRSSIRGGREYRVEMTKVMVQRGVLTALKRAGWRNVRQSR